MNNRQEQITILTNQLHKELFSSLENRNTKAARNTLNALNQLVKEEIKTPKK